MVRAMRWLPLVVGVLCVAGCGDNTAGTTPDPGPFSELPLDHDFATAGLDGPVHVARDNYGVAHIRARTVADAGYVQGYVMAHDRLPQMDILRRFGAGTLSELFGSVSPAVLQTDLEMRMHRMTYYATQTWEMLKASTDPKDAEVVQLLQRFADGVNAYSTDLNSGTWVLDPALEVSFDPASFRAWTPIDSLVLGRFQSFALSWSTPYELDLTELYQKLRDHYDGAAPSDVAAYARRGISRDLMTIEPLGLDPTVPGWPNVGTDTGTRSDDADPSARRAPAPPVPGADGRPHVPQALFDSARRTFQRGVHTGALGSYGPHAFMRPLAGSNNWAIGPSLLGGRAMLASDQHLQLANPTLFYPTHITVQAEGAAEPDLDVLGVTFSGIPGVILGSNGKVAWAATVSEHDVNDVYLEHFVPCPGGGTGSCVLFDGAAVPVQTFTEQIQIGAFGTINPGATRTVTYEVVPHHGPIIPTIANGELVPRTTDTGLSVKYTGYDPTFEIRAVFGLAHAQTVDQGFEALADFSYGSQNWTMIDSDANIGWTTNAVVPLRSPATYAWNATTAPDAAAPFFVLDGAGANEWQGTMDPRYIPHGYNPAQGYLATANADPVGETFDNDPLNGPQVDGRPLYAGVTYAAGVREARITQMIHAAGADLSLDGLATQQHDTRSNVGADFTPMLVAALRELTTPTDVASDVGPYLAALTPADRAKLATATELFTHWQADQFATPTGIDGADESSAATALFNTWMHFFLVESLGDEVAAIDFDLFRLEDNQLVRIAYAMLAHGDRYVQDPASHQPVLCNRDATAISCTKLVLQSMMLAMDHLASPAGYGTPDPGAWRWGQKHRLTIAPLFPNAALNLPKAGELPLPGFPKRGDNFVVNRADQGWADLNFQQYADGPAQRFLATTVGNGEPLALRWQLPGGVIFDSRSPHYRDLLDQYYLPEHHFEAPFSVAQINAAGESRWEFHTTP